MPLNKSTLLRLRTIDSCLCRRFRQWTIEDLRKACEDAVYDYEGIDHVSLRTTQRDIELMRSDKLGYNAPIIVVQRKYYTYEDPDYSITQLPLTKHDIEELNSAMDIIRHFNGFKGMAGSDDILARLQDRISQQENHRQVVFIDTNARLKGLHFLGELYDFIAINAPIVVWYKSFKSSIAKRIFLSPYILKEFNNRWFLIAHDNKRHNIMTLAIDRMQKIEKDKKCCYVPNTFFDAEDYFQSMVGVTRNINSERELITLRIAAEQAPYIITKPLHSSQQVIKENDDGSIVVTLQVIINMELEHLILGFCNGIEVIAPLALRKSIARKMMTAAAMYNNTNL
jgi:predicted DNA-binding transcriptional regulator YafY